MRIRELIKQSIDRMGRERDERWLEEHKDSKPYLFVNGLGGCPRRAFYKAYSHIDHEFRVEESHPFDAYMREKFKYGNDWEDITFAELSYELPGQILRDVPVGDDIWHGRIDYLIARTEQFPDGGIVEHKTTSTWNFTYSEAKRRLPFDSHCIQVLAYQYLFEKMYGIMVPAFLYYRSANNLWAEFEVLKWGPDTLWEGEIIGHEVVGMLDMSVDHEMIEMEKYWNNRQYGLPPKYPTPTSKKFGCTKLSKNGKLAYPTCQFFGACWGDIETPIEVT